MRNRNNEKLLNKDFKDDSIEDVTSFEEARAIINARLNTLRADLSYQSSAEECLFNELCKTHENKKRGIMDLYARFYSPCKVSDTSYEPKGDVDMNDVMLDFSQGYNEFIKNMENEYVKAMTKRYRATVLLANIMNIEYPYSRIMYLTYFIGMESKEIIDRLYISRATFYRLKSDALDYLTAIYYHPDKKDQRH